MISAPPVETLERCAASEGAPRRQVSFLQLLRRSGVDTPRVIRLHDVSTLEGSLSELGANTRGWSGAGHFGRS